MELLCQHAMSDSGSTSGSGSDSGSDGGSSGGSGPELDEKIEAILEKAPAEASIGGMLNHFAGDLGMKVEAFLRFRGAGVSKVKLLKVSFHATFLAELHPPFSHEGVDYRKVIVQVTGAELGDKALFGPVSAQNLAKATEIAERAGVRVPKILHVGEIDPQRPGVRPLGFVVEEFIETQTVEDQVTAPREQWCRIADDVRSKLGALSLDGVDTDPLPRFPNLDTWLQWLAAQVPSWDAPLLDALILFHEHVRGAPPSPRAPVLIHQDVNGGNLLCSRGASGEWALDALIDWESASVADPRTLDGGEPWSTARAFALVVKGSLLADRLASDTLPRCELAELVENAERGAHVLDKGTWLQYESWADRVERARAGRRT